MLVVNNVTRIMVILFFHNPTHMRAHTIYIFIQYGTHNHNNAEMDLMLL